MNSFLLDLEEKLKEMNLTKYRREAVHSTMRFWEESSKDERLIETAIDRGVQTAQLLKEIE